MMETHNTCLVTGASSGIGKHIACEMANRGWRVVAVARRKDRLDELAKSQEKDAIIPLACDVSDFDQVRAVSSEMVSKGLLPSLFFLNAGDGDEETKEGLDRELHKRVFEVNYFGVVNWVSHWLPIVREKGGATFVATSSLQSFRGMPGSAAYGASKAAVNHCFQSLDALYHRDNMRFVLVYPGPVDTPMLKTDSPLPVTWQPERAARYIVRKVERGSRRIAFPLFWRVLITLIRGLPRRVYVKMMS